MERALLSAHSRMVALVVALRLLTGPKRGFTQHLTGISQEDPRLPSSPHPSWCFLGNSRVPLAPHHDRPLRTEENFRFGSGPVPTRHGLSPSLNTKMVKDSTDRCAESGRLPSQSSHRDTWTMTEVERLITNRCILLIEPRRYRVAYLCKYCAEIVPRCVNIEMGAALAERPSRCRDLRWR